MKKNKSIVVTGGHGFLGKHVMKELLNSGFTNVKTFHTSEYNLLSDEEIFSMFVDLKPEVIIHLAADCGGIGYNKENPAKLFTNNAMMGIKMIHTSMQFLVEKFVQIGTVCSYPKFPSTIPFEEESLWSGYPEETNAPYGLAKKMLLTQIQAYNQQYDHFNGIYLIPTNLYGPNDDFSDKSSHVIPALIKKIYNAKLLEERCVTVWGDGSPTREFLHVKDAARAIVMAMEHYNKGEPCNIGTGKEISIAQLATFIKKIIGYEGDLVFDLAKPNGQPRRVLDIQKAYNEFGFKAMIGLEKGLTDTIKWYIDNKENI